MFKIDNKMMQRSLAYKFVISMILIAVWSAFVLGISFSKPGELGSLFNISIWFMLTAWFAFAFAIVLLILRIFGVFEPTTNIFYVFASTINLTIGLIAIALYFLHIMEHSIFHKYLLSLLVGFLIIADLFVFETNDSKTDTTIY